MEELIAGVDEAGRGPLAGPVVAAVGCNQGLEVTEGFQLGANPVSI